MEGGVTFDCRLPSPEGPNEPGNQHGKRPPYPTRGRGLDGPGPNTCLAEKAARYKERSARLVGSGVPASASVVAQRVFGSRLIHRHDTVTVSMIVLLCSLSFLRLLRLSSSVIALTGRWLPFVARTCSCLPGRSLFGFA